MFKLLKIKKFENSIENLKVSSSDINDNSLLRPQNLEYGDDKENSILNHPNVVRSTHSKTSKQNQNSTDDMELSKSQNKSGSSNNNLQSSNNMHISFLGSISKEDDFASKINQYLQVKDNPTSSEFSDSKNHKDLEAMLRTEIQSDPSKDKEGNKDELENSLMPQDLLNVDDSMFKSIIRSSSK